MTEDHAEPRTGPESEPDPDLELETRPRWTPTRWIVAAVIVVAWFAYLAVFGPKLPGKAPVLEGTAPGRPADYDWTLHDLDGRPVPFAQYRDKAVFLNIWATWCPPCVEEMPSIARLARTPGLAGVAFVCVATDEDAAAIRQFLAGKDWPMTILRATDVPPVFATDGIPATFLIAPDGRIAASVLGGANWDDPSVTAFLRHLAGAGPATPKSEFR